MTSSHPFALSQGSSQLLHSPPRPAKGGIQAGFVPVWDHKPREEWGWGVPAQGDRAAGWEGDRGQHPWSRAPAEGKAHP